MLAYCMPLFINNTELKSPNLASLWKRWKLGAPTYIQQWFPLSPNLASLWKRWKPFFFYFFYKTFAIKSEFSFSLKEMETSISDTAETFEEESSEFSFSLKEMETFRRQLFFVFFLMSEFSFSLKEMETKFTRHLRASCPCGPNLASLWKR